MQKDNALLSYQSSVALVEQARVCGVETWITSPGFRNSSLVLAIHNNSLVQSISAVDERGAAFLALGIAKDSMRPVGLLCTSGTAVANYMPAVLEAFYSGIPLFIVTADRPLELAKSGANQSTDQNKFFGSFVRFHADIQAENLTSTTYHTSVAVSSSMAPIAGPVHLNVRYTEPFLPTLQSEPDIKYQPWKILSDCSVPSRESVWAVAEIFSRAKRPAIVLGPSGLTRDCILGLCGLAKEWNIPLLCEASSGLSVFSDRPRGMFFVRTDAIFKSILDGSIECPDVFLRFGAPLTGKLYSRVLQEMRPSQLIFEKWGHTREPNLYPSVFFQGSPNSWIDALRGIHFSGPSSLISGLAKLEEREEQRLSLLFNETSWNEPLFYRIVREKMSPNSSIFLGNSLPIRDFNSLFVPPAAANGQVYFNRGLSGIDGLVATSVGIAFSSKKHLHAIVGELSFLHDLSSLRLAKSVNPSLTIWIMNNGGGQIFKHIPTKNTHGSIDWFTTPQDFSIEDACKCFDIKYLKIDSRSKWNDIQVQEIQTQGVTVVELVVDGGDVREAIDR